MTEIKYPADLFDRAAKIRLLLLDCDGVMTDGKVYFLPNGKGGFFETKGFDSHDGIALHWAKSVGIETGIISGRQSAAVEERSRSLGMKYLYQGSTDKMPLFKEILKDSGLGPEQVAFVGDDITDLPLLKCVGLAAAPINSRPEALDAAHFCTPSSGGQGAVRDVVELLLKAQGYWSEIKLKYDS